MDEFCLQAYALPYALLDITIYAASQNLPPLTAIDRGARRSDGISVGEGDQSRFSTTNNHPWRRPHDSARERSSDDRLP